MNESQGPDATAQGIDARYGRFLAGLFVGTIVGTIAGVYLRPRVVPATLYDRFPRVTDAVSAVGHAAADGYRRASTRIGHAVDTLRQEGEKILETAPRAVARAAEVASPVEDVRGALPIDAEKSPVAYAARRPS